MTAEADRLYEILRYGDPHREVYRARNSRQWFVTYGGGQFDEAAVQELLRSGLIQSVYSNCPQEAYHVGRTIDIDRTVEARKRLGKRAALVYVGDDAPNTTAEPVP